MVKKVKLTPGERDALEKYDRKGDLSTGERTKAGRALKKLGRKVPDWRRYGKPPPSKKRQEQAKRRMKKVKKTKKHPTGWTFMTEEEAKEAGR